MSGVRETTVPVTTRVTRDLVSQLDRLAAEFHLTRGHVVTLLLAMAVRREDELLATYRDMIAHARRGGGTP